MQGPSDDFSRPKGNGVCIARGVRGKIPLSARTKWHFFHQAFHLVWQSCHRASAKCSWCWPVIDWEASKRNLDAAKKILLPVRAAHRCIPWISEVMPEQCLQCQPWGTWVLRWKPTWNCLEAPKTSPKGAAPFGATPAGDLSHHNPAWQQSPWRCWLLLPLLSSFLCCSVGITCTVLEGSPHLFVLFNGVG